MRVGYLANNLGVILKPNLQDTVGLLGEAGRNLGNLAFWFAARRLFTDPIELVSWTSSGRLIRQRIDVLVIPAANFLNPAFDLTQLADLVESLDRPVVIWGLGAQSANEDMIPALQAGTLRFLRSVAARADKIFVRGEYSKRVCQHYGISNAVVAGCPSLFISENVHIGMDVQARYAGPMDRLYVAGSTYKDSAGVVDSGLFHQVVSRPGSSYVVQDPHELISFLLTGTSRIETSKSLSLALSTLRRDKSDEWARESLSKVGRFFTSVPDWLTAASEHDFAISMRIHGAVLAFMAGIPSIVVGHDTRVRELATTMSIPWISVSDALAGLADVEQLFRKIEFSGEAFDSNRSRLAALYVDQLEAASLHPSELITGLL